MEQSDREGDIKTRFHEVLKLVIEEALLRRGPFSGLEYRGLFDGEINAALERIDQQDRSDFEDLFLRATVLSFSGERLSDGLSNEVSTRAKKIAALYGKNVFAAERVDYRFTNPLEQVDWATAKTTIYEVAAAPDSKVERFRPPVQYRRMFPTKTMFFRISIVGYGGVVIGFEGRKLSIDDVCWLVDDSFQGFSMNLIALFKFPFLMGTMTRKPALQRWLQTYFAAVVMFAEEVSRQLLNHSEA